MCHRRYQIQTLLPRCGAAAVTAPTRTASRSAAALTSYPSRPGGSQLPVQPVQQQVTLTCQAGQVEGKSTLVCQHLVQA